MIETREEYDEVKDMPAKLLAKAELTQDGVNTFQSYGTVREFMIRLSEDFVKPTYGQDFWARAMVQHNCDWWGHIKSVVIVTDVGFESEVNYLGHWTVGDTVSQCTPNGWRTTQPQSLLPSKLLIGFSPTP
jgi:hypothetical protein